MTRLQTLFFHPVACDFAMALIVASLTFAYLPKRLRCMLISYFISFWCVAGACQWLPEFLLVSAFILLKYLCRIIHHWSITWVHLNPTMWNNLQEALNAAEKRSVLVWSLQVDGEGTFCCCIECMGENLREVLHPFVFRRLSMHMIDVASPFPSVAGFASWLTPI